MFTKTLAIMLTLAALALAVGCSNKSSPGGGETAQVASAPEPSGAVLWANNCSRCHNFRPPQSFSDAQWHAIVHHMRVRANLTGQEARLITEFLQSSH